MTEIIKTNGGHNIVVDQKIVGFIPEASGATDIFSEIEESAYRWHRHTSAPCDKMRMEVILLGDPAFTMVPGVSYNGNGWGDVPEYVGDRA